MGSQTQGSRKQQKQSGKCSGVNICPLRNLKQLLCRAEGTLPQEFCSSLDSKVPIFTGYFRCLWHKSSAEADVCRCSQLSSCLCLWRVLSPDTSPGKHLAALLMWEVEQLQAWFEGFVSHAKRGHWLMSPLISTSLASSITQRDGFKAHAVKTLHCHSLPLSHLRMFQAVQENEHKTCTWAVLLNLF